MAPLEKRGCNRRSTWTLPDIKDMDEKTNRISRRVYRWSKAARDLVRENINASGSELSRLVTHLVEESMNPRRACLRFAHRMGVRTQRSHRRWTDAEQQRLLKLIDLHPVREV